MSSPLDLIRDTKDTYRMHFMQGPWVDEVLGSLPDNATLVADRAALEPRVGMVLVFRAPDPSREFIQAMQEDDALAGCVVWVLSPKPIARVLSLEKWIWYEFHDGHHTSTTQVGAH